MKYLGQKFVVSHVKITFFIFYPFFRPASLTGRCFGVTLRYFLQLVDVGLVVKLYAHFSKLFFCVLVDQVAFAHEDKTYNIAKYRKELLHVASPFFGCLFLADLSIRLPLRMAGYSPLSGI